MWWTNPLLGTIFAESGPPNNNKSKNNLVEKCSPPIPPHLSQKQLEEVTKHLKLRKTNRNSTKLYVQASSPASNILKLRDAFPALPNKKIIKIHKATLNKEPPKGKKI